MLIHGRLGTTAGRGEGVLEEATCSTTGFDVPSNQSACQTVGDKVGQTFGMEVDFAGTCGNCEYRQYVRGSFRLNGLVLAHLLPGPANPPTYEPGQPMSQLHYLEDGLSPYPGFGPHFGHRDEVGAADDVYRDPNRATGCEYRGDDFPGISGLVEDDTYDIHLEFLGEVIDTVADMTLRRSTWTIACSGTVA